MSAATPLPRVSSTHSPQPERLARFTPRVAMLLALTLALALTLILMPVLPTARAQTMADPTQPPPESRLAAPGVDAAAAAPTRPGPQLQSVLIGTRGREVAVIDGQTLRKGDKFNGAVLVRISKNQVVLQHGRERQMLTLFPDAGAEAKAPAQTRAPTH
jgi:MSHA biogenesis protein MshK